ncbi:hypothetical protein ABZ802_07065 [Streptomyces sp. NPDC047737]|uniref:hypothetical protein n=1 Tax=Streptomyces sp. NPDC047737 TaxID=3155740 RepID=UPI0033FC28BA
MTPTAAEIIGRSVGLLGIPSSMAPSNRDAMPWRRIPERTATANNRTWPAEGASAGHAAHEGTLGLGHMHQSARHGL